jgi:hypothetical protein
MLAATGLLACGDDGGSAEALCEVVRTDRSVAAVFSGFDPTDTERALEQLRTARVTLGELRDAAPEEVRDDLGVEIDYVQALIEGLDGIEAGDASQAVEVVRQVTNDHADVGDAAANLATFSQERCQP